MWTRNNILFVILIAVFPCIHITAQEDIFEQLLKEEVEVIDPQYKPVVGFGGGMTNFFGESSYNYKNPIMGEIGGKVSVATYIDSRNHYYRANFYLLASQLSGEKFNYTWPGENNTERTKKNLNFQSSIIAFGINVDYSFGHFTKKNPILTPYISLGIESVQFNSKTDSLFEGASTSTPYYYWDDGSIRDIPENEQFNQEANYLSRDYNFETDLREKIDYGLSSYAQNAFTIPIDLGVEFKVSERVAMRVGHSFHFMLTDNVDHISSENTKGPIGDKKNDRFNFTYLSLHLDLFSDPTTIVIDKLFAEFDFDYTMFDDEDYDGTLDGWDDCPDTPKGIEVDSTGCPFDDDLDGVPNYKDKELRTPANAYIDEDGVQITEDELIAMLNRSENAVNRDEVDLYIRKIVGYNKYFGTSSLEIPDKFKHVDIDADGYISFDELLKSIDDFFDFESDMSTEDIYELNGFFFAQ